MRYHNITKDDMLNGDGLRVVLWVAGCNHHCEDCQNPVTWDIHGGLPFDDAAEKELFHELQKDYISGITFSGGDPLHPDNREDAGRLMEKIRRDYPDKTIWCYTGYLFEQVMNLPLMRYVDVLVDGRYEKTLRDTKLHWKGSTNQRVINVPESLDSGRVILHNEIGVK